MTPPETWFQMAPGVKRRIREDGEKLMLVEVQFEAGAVVAEHHHVHEQVSYIVSGRMVFTMEGKEIDVAAGGSLRMPSDVPHAARAVEPSVALDAFSPPREDFRK
jgi:quercetin dioxygenase-like cupin family protein